MDTYGSRCAAFLSNRPLGAPSTGAWRPFLVASLIRRSARLDESCPDRIARPRLHPRPTAIYLTFTGGRARCHITFDFERPLRDEGRPRNCAPWARRNTKRWISKRGAALDKKAADLLVSLYKGLSHAQMPVSAASRTVRIARITSRLLFTEYTPLGCDLELCRDHAVMAACAINDIFLSVVIGH